MRPFARRAVVYVRSVGSNPTLSFGGDGYIVLSPNSNKNLSSVRLRAPLLKATKNKKTNVVSNLARS